MPTLLFKEILHRKINFLLSMLAVAAAVAFLVAFFTTSQASRRETIRLTRDMGFNLRIIPKETNMDDFWNNGFSQTTMPEDYVLRFNAFKNFSYAHLTATLHERVNWRGMDVILTGISPEIEPSGKKKTPMIFSINPGNIYVGYEVARTFDLQKDDIVDLFGKKFTVAKTLAESGSSDDIRIFAPLDEVQEMLGKEGRINEIKALNCVCLTDDADPLILLRQQLAQVLPESRLVMNRTIAVAREEQRRMIENYFALLLPFIVIIAAAWVGVLAWINVRERRQEIGVLRALGYSAGKIAVLFLGKAVLLGLLGALIGFAVGTALSLFYGPDIFKITAKAIKPDISLLLWSLAAAPLFAAFASFIPAALAVAADPAVTLREE